MLLDHRTKLKASNSNRHTPLHAAVSQSGSRVETIVRVLLDRGTELDLKSKDGRTPLHLALSQPGSHAAAVVRVLLDTGADIDVNMFCHLSELRGIS